MHNLNNVVDDSVIYVVVFRLQEVMLTFHTAPQPLPNSIVDQYPAFLHLSVLSRKLTDMSVPRQLVACAIKTLRAAAVRGVHTLTHTNHINILAFHIKLGFSDITNKNSPEDMLVLGQNIW